MDRDGELIELLRQQDKETLVKAMVELLSRLGSHAQLEYLQRLTDAKSAAEVALPDDQDFLDTVARFVDRARKGWFLEEVDMVYRWGHPEADEWAEELDELFTTAGDYFEAERYSTAVAAYRALLDVLTHAEFKEMLFPAEFPQEVLETDVYDATGRYFNALFRTLPLEEYIKGGADDAVRFHEYGGPAAFDAPLIEGEETGRAADAILEPLLRRRLGKITHDFNSQQSVALDQLLALYDRRGDGQAYLQLCIRAVREGEKVGFVEQIVERYEQMGELEEALRWAEQGLRKKGRSQIDLLKRAAEISRHLGDAKAALDYDLERFAASPNIDLYQVLRREGEELGEWQSVRERALQSLRTDDSSGIFGTRGPFVLVQILLFERRYMEAMKILDGLVGDAHLETLKLGGKFFVFAALGGLNSKGLLELDRLLNRARKEPTSTHEFLISLKWSTPAPEEQAQYVAYARTLYHKLVDTHIAAKQRGRYAAAAYYVTVLRDLYTLTGEEEQFRRFYSKLLASYPRHRALQEEMQNRVGTPRP